MEEDYSKGLWMAAKVYGLMSDHPKTITLKSSRKKNPKKFIVNKAALCHYSSFFEKAFNGNWKESHEMKVEFEVDVSQSVLRLFDGWLATGQVFTNCDSEPIFELYRYADYISCLALRRAVMTHALSFCNRYEDGLSYITYQSLRDSKILTEHRNSSLYKWIVDTFAFHWEAGWDEEYVDCDDEKFDVPDDVPGSFFYDQRRVLQECRQDIKKGVAPGECRCCKSACTYHEHSSEAERKATCGAEGEDLVLSWKFWKEDADDINELDEETVSEHEDQAVDAEMEGRSKEDENNRVVEELVDTVDTTEGIEPDANDKRKVQDDAEEKEAVSAKKHKQEI
ncbi:hypothetical protein KCU65_g7760, partial [Aureobasidium melanogenum]